MAFDLLLLGLLILVALAGITMAVFQLPGTWLTLIGAVAYDWHYGWTRFGWKWLVALGIVALAAECLELLSSAVIARRAGASRQASIGALIGGFAGIVALSPTVPIFGIGPILGGLFGCFLGALIGELSVHSRLDVGARVGVMAAVGRLFGLMLKAGAAVVIAGTVATKAAFSML